MPNPRTFTGAPIDLLAPDPRMTAWKNFVDFEVFLAAPSARVTGRAP
jgi:hypothetical protein